MQKLVLFSLISATTISCATPSKSILTGAAIGGGAGTFIGHQHGEDNKGRVTGAAAGAALGGLVGYLYNKEKNKKQNTKDNNAAKPTETPFLTRPKVRMYWEPDRIEGNKYIEKHKVWVLESTPSWTKGK